MSSKVILATEYVKFIKEKYKGLEVPIYKLRKWFSKEQKIFFDCEDSEKISCLYETLNQPNFPAFRIYLVVKDLATRSYSFMDISFRNLGKKENLKHFISRYHQQLETMTKISLQGAGRKYIDCVGYSYEETTK